MVGIALRKILPLNNLCLIVHTQIGEQTEIKPSHFGLIFYYKKLLN